MITEKNKFLELEEIKNLIEKVYAAQQAGNYVNFIYSNFSVSVLTMLGEFDAEKEFVHFNISLVASHEKQKADYDKCIAHLEILAGEEHDN